jgi:chorismate dehydratase
MPAAAGSVADPELRVGAIDFLNCFPLTWGLERIGGLPGCHVVADTPDRLSDLLVAGDLDLGPISLVEALKYPEGLEILDAPAVVADGPAGSVCLVSRRPMDDLDGATVALGSTSRTSVELARMLLEERHGVRPRYVTLPPDVDRMLAQADAAVLIGDPALRLGLAGVPEGVRWFDLAQEWKAWTGLPMVFAVWAVRSEARERAPRAVEAATSRLRQALAAADADPAAVARAAAQRSGLAEGALAAYFAGLDVALDARSRAGMDDFAQRWRGATRSAP